MKVKIKGLVFVGFAAAILSANAMAEGENIVTSKSYVDAKIVQTTDGTATDKAPSENAVKTALANKQINQGSVDKYQVSKNGGWVDASGAVSGGTYITATPDGNTGATALDVKATTAFTNVGTTAEPGTDAAKLPTALAVKEYVDGKTGANIVVQHITDGNTTTAPSEDVVHDALELKQDYSNASSGTYKLGHTGKTWATLGTEGYVTIDNTTDASAPKIKLDSSTITSSSSLLDNSTKLTREQDVKGYADSKVAANETVANIDTTSTTTAPNEKVVAAGLALKEDVANKTQTIDNNSDSAHYPSAEAVYNYVQSQTGGTVIPGKAALCDSHPCALVNDSTGAHWRTMATAGYNGGVLADYCDANNSCSLGTCNQTSSACEES